MILKVFHLNDCDWYVGDSFHACRQQSIIDYGEDLCDDYDGHELDEEELNRLRFHCEDNPDVVISFAEQLQNEIIEGGEFPRLFASTEY